MSKWFRCSLLVAAAVAMVGISSSSNEIYGQAKKKTEKTGYVVVNEGKDGKFRLSIRDKNDKYLVGSLTGFATKDDALKMLDSIKAALENPEIKETKGEQKKGKAKGE